MKALVSIIVPAYNASNTILDTIKSIDEQTYRNFECIIVDDGSSDSAELCKRISVYLSKDKYKYFKKENGGVSSARNWGANKASGDYLMFVDSDDKIASSYIEKCLNILEVSPELALVCTNVQEFERSNNKISHKIVGLKEFIFHNAIFPCIALIRTADFKRVGGYDEKLKVCEDWDLYISLLKNNEKYFVIPEYLYFYRKRLDESSLTDQIDCQKISKEIALNRIFDNHKDLYHSRIGSIWNMIEKNNEAIKISKRYSRTVSLIFILSLISFFIALWYDPSRYIPIIVIFNISIFALFLFLSNKFKKEITKYRY
ncbi:glycosyltransferase [Acinetobacter pittii]|uniref:glycosyltransferase n=1 Tax=Acinetobacter pittii TaxID=48296 RepID=UPI00190238BB|nr:glycosyltransferase [Acinetobacter pittii]MBJ8434710.1 glycosyltransferase [Acinetobacter pittii]